MSLVTSCPQCLTAFRVTDEQLAAKDGQVRCGRCQHIFNAHSRLAKTSGANNNQPDPVPAPAIKSPKLMSDTASPDAKLANPRPKFKLPRWLSALLIGVLVLLAAFQAVYYLRASIAAQWPMLRPHLIAACQPLQCTVSLPQQAELLTIDDSDMLEDGERQGVVHLSATLVNNAPFTQAYPLLEVTLTDAYDKPVLRRAIVPSDYLPAGERIDEGIAPGESLQIRLALAAGDAAVAGYRIFVGY